jgi:polysaccharide biosynthesis protein PslH
LGANEKAEATKTRGGAFMKILQLCLKPPLPAKDGGCIAMNNVTMGLLESGHQVKILTIFTQKHNFVPEDLPQEYLDKTQIEGVYIDTHVNIVDAFANFITSDSYNIARFFSADFDIKLTRLLKYHRFDVIHLESLFMTPYLPTIRRHCHTPVVLRSHNLEFVIWERIARGTNNVFKRVYLNYLARKMKKYEISMLNYVNGIASISDEDRQRFYDLGIKRRIKTIPFGIDLRYYPAQHERPCELALFHIGAMDWGPNIEGIQWFLHKIWMRVHEEFPNLKLYLAGRNMPMDEMPQLPNVVYLGEVDDAIEFIHSKKIMIVPLLSAGGIRVKIIEGLAMEKAVISTSLGAEGIECTHQKNILLADTPSQWIDAITELVSDPKRIDELGQAGREHVRNYFDITGISKSLIQFYKELRHE